MQHESEEFEVLTTLKVSDQVTTYDDILSPNMDTIRVNKMLEEEIYNLFLESPFKSKYSTWRKVDKKDVYDIFYYFKDKLIESKKYNLIDIFISIAEFFEMNYNILYDNITLKDKEIILQNNL